MKKKSMLIISLILLASTISFAKENIYSGLTFSDEQLNEKLLVSIPGTFGSLSCQTPSGTMLSAKEVNEKLRSISKNESVMRSYTAWNCIGWILLGTGLTSFVANKTLETLSANGSAQNMNTVVSITSYASVISLLAATNASLIASHKRRLAIDNYNLHQLGE